MRIVTMTVKDDISKPRTARMFLNWKLTWQHSLDEELGVGHMIEHRGVLELEK